MMFYIVQSIDINNIEGKSWLLVLSQTVVIITRKLWNRTAWYQFDIDLMIK